MNFNIKEVDFSNYFYNIEGTSKQSNQKQYMHRPSLKKVKEQITKVGFDLVFNERSDVISSKKTREAPPMFYVCKK